MKERSGNGARHLMVRLLGGERIQPIAVPLFFIVLSIVAASAVVLMVGKNPLSAFYSLLQGAGVLPKASYAAHKNMLTDLTSMLGAMTPMIFAALAVAVAYRAGLFNIGVSGQMLCAGFVATITVGYSELPGVVAKPLVLLIGAASGALVGGLIGLLKHRFNINEVVSSIMLNYILQYAVAFCINSWYVDPVSRQSRYISAAARLTLMDVPVGDLKMELPVCIVLAVLCAVALRFLLDRTRVGYEIRTVGQNPVAARYAGIGVGGGMLKAMVLSGALAGLAGVTYYLGYFNSIPPRDLSSVGFDAIAVSLLGNSNPVGILFSSLLITIISKGSTYMSSAVGLQQEIASVITGLILLFSACSAWLVQLVNRWKAELESATAPKAEKGGDEA